MLPRVRREDEGGEAMSMLSEQCARLRSWAAQFDERADLDALAPLFARDLREAADTIEDLRDRLQNQAFALGMQEALGSGTCELVVVERYSNTYEVINVLECSECGKTCEHVNGSYPRCPHCGAKVRGGGDD